MESSFSPRETVSELDKFIIGQIGQDGRVQGVGKEINMIVYEG